MTLELIIIIAGLLILMVLTIIFRGSVKTIEFAGNKITMGNKSAEPIGPILEESSARLYTQATVRLTKFIGNLERKVMLSEMMRHGEEGLTYFCNQIRSDFRDFLSRKGFSSEQIDDYANENELVVNQIDREMHGWILLAMRQNSIPIDDDKLDRYVKEKFDLWDSETDEIRRKIGKSKSVHNDFLCDNKTFDSKYLKIMMLMFKKAAIAEKDIIGKITCAVKAQQELEDHFAETAQVKKNIGCIDDL